METAFENWPCKSLIITVDVEASPFRQSADHVERLIWGRFGGEELGIGRMMAIASRYKRPLAFFVDLCEIPRYPGAFDEIAQAILREGHDLQLHAHPEVLPPDFWTDRKISPATSNLSVFGREQALALFEFLTGSARRVGQTRPVAFRGGGFRYNDAVLDAMAEYGVTLGFNYRYKATHQSNNSELLPTFRWSNGITEFPMSLLKFGGRLQAFDFGPTSSLDFSELDSIQAFMNQYFAELGDDAVLVMLMHSWSFLSLDPVSNHFQAQGDRLALLFERFLAELPSDIEVITAGQAARLIERGLFCPALVRDVDLANRAKYGCADTARIMNLQGVREAVRRVLPPDAVVLVVSKGDDGLLHLDGRRGWHFPQTADGVFAGYYPGDDTEAIAHLEALRAKGAQFLLIPATSLWWLEYYREFRQHLERNYQQLMHEENTCAIYDLRPRDDRQSLSSTG